MESLLLMLQATLLLLCCALSRYLWEINITVASVVLGITSFGVIFYLLILIAGTASASCPYQTPSAHIFCYILHHHLPTLHLAPSIIIVVLSSGLSSFTQNSWCWHAYGAWQNHINQPWYSMNNITYTLLYSFIGTPIALVHNAHQFGQAMFWLFATSNMTAYHWLVEYICTTVYTLFTPNQFPLAFIVSFI